MSHNKLRRGFTLVEIMLAMSVLSILLLAIATLVIQIGRTYSRGVTLKSLNQAATTISRDVQRTLNQANADDVLFVNNVGLDASKPSGRLCTGNITYAWNHAGYAGNVAAQPNKYSGVTKDLRFVRVSDPDNALCGPPPYPAIDSSKAKELLPSGQYELAMYSFYVGSALSSKLKWVTMDIGSTTIIGSLDASGNCTGGKTNEFCARNVFEFTARAGATSLEDV